MARFPGTQLSPKSPPHCSYVLEMYGVSGELTVILITVWWVQKLEENSFVALENLSDSEDTNRAL